MKPLTFEEWQDDVKDLSQEGAFSLARHGMIPEDEAIRIPPVWKWPQGAKGFWAKFTFESLESIKLLQDQLGFGIGTYIPRPIPQWTPKVGETVFAYTGYVIWVAVVVRIDDEKIYALCSIGTETEWSLDELKPFDHKYIGRNEWEAIPRP